MNFFGRNLRLICLVFVLCYALPTLSFAERHPLRERFPILNHCRKTYTLLAVVAVAGGVIKLATPAVHRAWDAQAVARKAAEEAETNRLKNLKIEEIIYLQDWAALSERLVDDLLVTEYGLWDLHYLIQSLNTRHRLDHYKPKGIDGISALAERLHIALDSKGHRTFSPIDNPHRGTARAEIVQFLTEAFNRAQREDLYAGARSPVSVWLDKMRLEQIPRKREVDTLREIHRPLADFDGTHAPELISYSRDLALVVRRHYERQPKGIDNLRSFLLEQARRNVDVKTLVSESTVPLESTAELAAFLGNPDTYNYSDVRSRVDVIANRDLVDGLLTELLYDRLKNQREQTASTVVREHLGLELDP